MSSNAAGNASNIQLVRWLTCLMFFTFAMTTDAVGSVIPRLIKEHGLSMTAGGAFQYATMGGIAAGALLLGFLADRIGRKLTVILGLSLYGVASLLVAASGNFTMLVTLLAISGLGISVFKTGALALIGDISPTTAAHTRFMNTVEGFFAVGAIVGPAIVGVLVGAGMSWKWLYAMAALICAALVIMAAAARYPGRSIPVKRADLRQMLAMLKDPLALGFSLLVMLYVAVECAIYVWMPTLLTGYQGSYAWLAASALTLFFVLRALGRFAGAWLLGRVSWTVALAIMALLIFACFGGSLVGGVDAAAWLLPLTGLFMSIVYPTLNSKAISCFPKDRHGAIAGVILFFTAAAAAIGPLSMGAVSDAWHDARAGFVLATVLALLLLAGLAYNALANPAARRLQLSDGAA
ncbi:MAG: MFS transporter [Pseudomonadota bacterium]